LAVSKDKWINEYNICKVEEPELHAGELLLKVDSAGICGSEMKVIRGVAVFEQCVCMR